MDSEELFRQLPPVPVPADLSRRVIAEIHYRQQRRAKIRVFWLSLAAGLSFAGIFPALAHLIRLFAVSGFWQYARLALSDGAALSGAWQEFLLSLAESLPLLALTFFIAAIFIFLWSALAALKEARLAHFANLT